MLHLKSATDFERVRRDGRSHAHPLVVLIARPRGPAELPTRAPGRASLPEPRPRFGIVAGRAVGTAVARNRAKRLLREAARAAAPSIAPGWDVLLIARRPLAQAKLPEAQAALSQLLRRARLLAGPAPAAGERVVEPC
ncbi:MAG: ribonuclease P protein component [Anaerolineales bacterium]|nr:ribonuclease P protein component [Anaerolineales bacterium]